ncbi:HAD-like domain-containing protein [Ganoderma leucocontextum]|nr:HAD-like domain-containing protein [Ganoderma leucocontextum]
MAVTQTQSRQCDNIVVDFGGVLFTWSANTMTPVRPKLLRRIFSSSIWFEYERGNITEQECVQLVAAEFSVFEVDFARALKNARRSIRPNDAVFDLLRNMKKRSDVRIFAVANMSSSEWDLLRRKMEPEVWALFDHIYTSADVSERKPNLGFFKFVLDSAGLNPARTVLVDNRTENVVSAASIGMNAITFTTAEELSRALTALTRDAVADAERWMRGHAQEMWSVTDTGVALEENFGQLLILDVTKDAGSCKYRRAYEARKFLQRTVLTSVTFPNDLNTTSTACMALGAFRQEVKDDIIDEILSIKTREGLVPTYFDTTRPRIDPVVNVNVLTFFCLNGRGHELPEALDWVHAVLHARAYEHGTLYFPSGDAFLYFLSRLLAVSPAVRQRLGKLFAERVQERSGAEGDALALAMRVTAAASVGGRAARDYERLMAMQEEDGSWPVGWMYKYGSSGVRIGNKGLTTAMAVAAIRKYGVV